MSKNNKTSCIIIILNVIFWVILLGVQTFIISGIESKFDENIEKFKSALRDESKIKNIQREIYTDMAKSMLVFLASRDTATIDEENLFKQNYSSTWLWACDSTILELNNFLNLQIIHFTKKTKHHLAYTNTMLAMRKDIIPDTKLISDDFIFVQFVQKK